MIDDLILALKAEFGVEYVVYTSPPSTLVAPSVIIRPGEPFLANGTHRLIEERWQIVVTAKLTAPDSGVGRLREMSLRVRRAVSTVGAMWIAADAPATLASDSSAVLSVDNEIMFRYDPTTITT